MAKKNATQTYVDSSTLETLYNAFPEEGKQDTISAAAHLLTWLNNETGILSPDLLCELVEGLTKARRLTLGELAGTFTREELVGLLDAFNGTLVRGINLPAREVLRYEMEDAETLDGIGARHGYNSETLLKKISGLTHAQAETLLLELRVFWETQSGMDNALENFLNRLTQ
jgi:hypothetical protein